MKSSSTKGKGKSKGSRSGHSRQKTKYIKIEIHEESLFDHFKLACFKDYRGILALQPFLKTGKIDVNQRYGEKGNFLLYNAVKNNMYDLANVLLIAGADPNMIRYDGESALFRACQERDVCSVEILLENGADTNIPVHINGRNVFNATFMWANACDNSEHIGKLLLEHGFDPNKKHKDNYSSFEYSIIQDQSRMLDILLKPHYNKNTSLFLCCIREYESSSLLHNDNLPRDMFNEIIKHTSSIVVNPNQEFEHNHFPLYTAVNRNSPRCVKSLLKAGANPNRAFVYLKDVPPPNQITPILKAAVDNRKDIVELLIKYKANTKSCDCLGRGLLEFVKHFYPQNTEVIKFLEELESTINREK